MNQHYWCQSRSNIAVIEFDGYRGQSVDVAARGGDICHVNLDLGVLRIRGFGGTNERPVVGGKVQNPCHHFKSMNSSYSSTPRPPRMLYASIF